MVCGLKLTVVPDGIPEADKLTAAAKPLPVMVKMLEVPCSPWAIVRAEGMVRIVKPGCPLGVMVRVTVVVCLTPPPYPITVIGKVPVGAKFTSWIVMIELPEPGAPMVMGLKVTDTPMG